MIIDFHSHHFPDRVAARAIAGMCKRTEGYLWAAGDGTLANHLDNMEHDGIDAAVLCQIATKPSQYQVLLDYALSLSSGMYGERAKKMIIPFMSIHPADRLWEQRLEEIASKGIKGIKVHPYYQNFHLDDSRVWPMFRKMAELKLVVVCHCGYDIGYPGRKDACGPKEIATLLENVKGLCFVAAHLGGCSGFPTHSTDRIIELGAYADTSALIANRHRDEEMRLLASWPRERLLFGTDFPWTNYAETVRWVKSVRDEADWDLIFSGNAKRILGRRVCHLHL
jgi:predicted TIM-barrel fold metal-dependent hydrolase